MPTEIRHPPHSFASCDQHSRWGRRATPARRSDLNEVKAGLGVKEHGGNVTVPDERHFAIFVCFMLAFTIPDARPERMGVVVCSIVFIEDEVTVLFALKNYPQVAVRYGQLRRHRRH